MFENFAGFFKTTKKPSEDDTSTSMTDERNLERIRLGSVYVGPATEGEKSVEELLGEIAPEGEDLRNELKEISGILATIKALHGEQESIVREKIAVSGEISLSLEERKARFAELDLRFDANRDQIDELEEEIDEHRNILGEKFPKERELIMKLYPPQDKV